VPADCTVIVAFWAHFDGNNNTTLSGLTLNGASFTTQAELAEGATTDESGVGVAVLANPATGSQTLAWTWSAGGARSEGGEIVLVYVTGADTVSPAHNAAVDARIGSTAPSVTVDSTTTDLVLGFVQSFSGSPPLLTGTVFINNGTVNSEVYDVAQEVAGAASTTFNVTNVDYASMAAISIRVASGDVSVGLTGSALSSTAGALGPAASKAVSGFALTGAQGALDPALSKGLTGSALSSLAGTLIPSFSLALTGQALAIVQGSVSAGGDLTLSLTGQALTLSSGTLSPATAGALVGSALAAAAGTAGPATSKALSGSSATMTTGTIAPALSRALNGNLLTTGQGAVSAPGNVTLALGGQAMSAAQGSFGPALSKGLTGSSAATVAGSVVAAPSKALTGQQLAADAGAFGVTFSAGLTGSLASMTQGTVFSASSGIVTDLRVTFVAVGEQTTFVARPEPAFFTAKKILH
jgi:hypothetical protein